MDGDCHERRDRDIEKAQRTTRRRVPEGVSLVDELIRERREEAAGEERRMAVPGPLDPEAVRRRMAEFKRGSHGAR